MLVRVEVVDKISIRMMSIGVVGTSVAIVGTALSGGGGGGRVLFAG